MSFITTNNGTLIPDEIFTHDISLSLRFNYIYSKTFYSSLKKSYDIFSELFSEYGVYPKKIHINDEKTYEIWIFKTNKKNATEDKEIIKIITEISDKLYDIFDEQVLNNSDIQVDFVSSKGSMYTSMILEDDKYKLSNTYCGKYN